MFSSLAFDRPPSNTTEHLIYLDKKSFVQMLSIWTGKIDLPGCTPRYFEEAFFGTTFPATTYWQLSPGE
jgi:hypothetical protein